MRQQDDTPREPLNRARALEAAVALADESGIDSVSMRNLAGRLGVVPMALYKHVANKDDLLGGMVDVVIAEYDLEAPTGTDWKEGIRARVLSAREALGRHPWARQVIETRTTRTPSVLGYMDALAGVFIAGGFSPDLTHHVMHVLGHRIWGFSPEAFDESRDASPSELADPRQDSQRKQEMIARMEQVYPHIVAIALAASEGDPARVGTGCDEQFEFEFALDLLLDSFERLLRAGGVPGRATRT